METTPRLDSAQIEERIYEIISKRFDVPRRHMNLQTELLNDLQLDSLDAVELVMSLEESFDMTLEEPTGDDLVYKSVFTRPNMTIGDLVETVFIRQGSGRLPLQNLSLFSRVESTQPPPRPLTFSQLDGRWVPNRSKENCIFERIDEKKDIAPGTREFRRRSDGMRCVLLPSAEVDIGSCGREGLSDESPQHRVALDSFLIDAEPVSTTAYCRFLNSIAEPTPDQRLDWFVLAESDSRHEHVLIEEKEDGWKPRPGVETWPMVLVSWYGANAYSLWANGQNWNHYRDDRGNPSDSFLPSEAQWEYAARGVQHQKFPWGNVDADGSLMRYGQHVRGATYTYTTLPMAPVNVPIGLSPFGLLHMAGNVWQWCRDWYDKSFYASAESRGRNALNTQPSGVRSERGGSWIGSADLCRSSYRRGRNPFARGRCLGFRCVSRVGDITRELGRVW